MRYRWIVLAALAVFALSGVAASSAAATETLSFVPQSPKFPVKVTVKGGEVLFTEESISYGCSSVTGEGEITSHKAAKIKFTFKHCFSVQLGLECKSSGAAKEEIKTGNLPVQLVYISKAKHEAALDINYQVPSEEFPPPPHNQLASWECGLVSGMGARWSIIGAVTPVNTSTLSHTVKLAQSSPGIQKPTKYETEEAKTYEAFPELNLLGGTKYFQGSVTDELEVTSVAGQGTVEIKA